jgi:methionyl-tRNA formyltransferase
MKILFFGKRDDALVNKALRFLERKAQVERYLGEWGESFPDRARKWEGDLVVSYLSRWVIPTSVLTRARLGGINFHPGSRNYPGIGCVNFALYEQSADFGPVCHGMLGEVDTGTIIDESIFPVFEDDTVESLLERTHDHMLILFYRVMADLFCHGIIRQKVEGTWARVPFTRQQLNNLAKLDHGMNAKELELRIRSTSFGKWKPLLLIDGIEFEPR